MVHKLLVLVGSVVLGVVTGSFLTTVIERLPRGESFARGRSRCGACWRPLRALELVPVFSFLALRGRCRGCGEPIPRWHLGVEVACAALFAALAWTCQECSTWDLLLRSGMGAILLALAVIDFQTLLLPNALTGALAVLGGVRSVALDIPGVSASLGGALVAVLVLGSLWAAPEVLRRGFPGRAVAWPALMGLGDVKLGVSLGLALGPLGTATMLFGAFVLGGAVGALLLVTRRAGLKSHIPFGPFLAGVALLLLLAPDILSRLLGLLGL